MRNRKEEARGYVTLLMIPSNHRRVIRASLGTSFFSSVKPPTQQPEKKLRKPRRLDDYITVLDPYLISYFIFILIFSTRGICM